MGYYDGNPPGLRSALSKAVIATTDQFAAAFNPDKLYAIDGDVPFWYKWSTTGGGVAAGDAGAIFVPTGKIRYDSPPDATNVFLQIIRSGGTSGLVNAAVVSGPIGL